MTARKNLVISIAGALALGLVVRTGNPWLIIFSVLAPALFLAQRKREDASLCAGVYYLGALFSLPHAVTGFFGPGETRAQGLYLVASALLAVPWLLVWGTNYLCLRSIAGVLLGVVPPLGLIDWASPVMAAGWLFPGTSVFGGVASLLVLVAAFSEVVHRHEPLQRKFARGVYVSVIALALGSNLAYFAKPKTTPKIWEGVTLHAEANCGAVAEYANVLKMKERAGASPADVVVFPEGAQENWSEVKEFVWADTFSALREKHHIVLVGTTSLEAGTQYRNGFVIRGAEVNRFQQRIPVPLAMWRPFTASSGVPLRLFSPGSVRIGGELVGVLMCYEMSIPWPALATLTERPTRLVGLANDWWAIETPSVPRWQATALEGWARLAGIPSTLAINLPKDTNL